MRLNGRPPAIMPTIRTLLGGLIFTLFLPHAAEAHEKWFIDPATRGEVPDLFRSLTFQTWTAIGATAAPDHAEVRRPHSEFVSLGADHPRGCGGDRHRLVRA